MAEGLGPTVPIEDLVRELWLRALRRDSSDDRKGFFTAGGDSLTAALFIKEVRDTTGVQVPFGLVFDNVALAEILRFVRTAGDVDVAVSSDLSNDGSVTGRRSFPVLPRMQAALERYHWGAANSRPIPLGTTGILTRVRGRLEIERLRGAHQRVIDRHEALRLVFDSKNGEVCCSAQQRVHAQTVVVEVHAQTTDPVEAVAAVAFAPFAPAESPKARLVVAQIGADEHLLAVAASHLVCDASGLETVTHELAKFYNEPSVTDDRDAGGYREYLEWYQAWLGSPEAAADRRYWLSKLRGGPAFPEFFLPGATRQDGYVNFEFSYAEAALPSGTAALIARCAVEVGASPFVIFATAVVATMVHYGCRDIAFLTPASGRVAAAADEVVCWHNTMLLLRVDADAGTPIPHLMASLRKEVAESISHSLFPIQQVALEVSREQVLRPRRQVSLLVGCEIDTATPMPVLDGADAERIPLYGKGSALGCDIRLRERDDTLYVSVAHDVGWLPPERTRTMADDIAAVLPAICRDGSGLLGAAADWVPNGSFGRKE